jgi:hypothetical protein
MSSCLGVVPLTAFVLMAAGPLAAQGTPASRNPTRSPARTDSLAAALDSMRVNQDALRRRAYFFRDSLQPMMVRAFAARRVRIGVVVRGWPSETDTIGALIDAVTPGGPAAVAGLRSGDVITRLGNTPLAVSLATVPPGTKVPNPGLRLVELVAHLQPGDTVAVEYRRGKARKMVRLVTAVYPDNFTVVVGPDGDYRFGPLPGGLESWVGGGEGVDNRALEWALQRSEAPRGAHGDDEARFSVQMGGSLRELELAPVNPQLGSYFGTTEGVLVVDVPDPAPLALKAGDVVLSVDGRSVSSPDQLMRVLGSYDADETVRLNVMRQKKRIILNGTLGR